MSRAGLDGTASGTTAEAGAGASSSFVAVLGSACGSSAAFSTTFSACFDRVFLFRAPPAVSLPSSLYTTGAGTYVYPPGALPMGGGVGAGGGKSIPDSRVRGGNRPIAGVLVVSDSDSEGGDSGSTV